MTRRHPRRTRWQDGAGLPPTAGPHATTVRPRRLSRETARAQACPCPNSRRVIASRKGFRAKITALKFPLVPRPIHARRNLFPISPKSATAFEKLKFFDFAKRMFFRPDTSLDLDLGVFIVMIIVSPSCGPAVSVLLISVN